MKTIREVKRIWNREVKMIDIWYYFQGMYRYRIYYNSKLQGVVIRVHIREQITYRIKIMNRECYNSGSCIKCGCMTTALQMCDKVCDGNCYPEMMNKKSWEEYKRGKVIILKNKIAFKYV